MTATWTLWAISALLLLVYVIGLATYRLFLSPIAHFPGSKLTIISGWYETYFDVFKGGQFTYQIEKWHEQYGSIIRINPTELHISDPDFYGIAFSSSTPFQKLAKWRDRFGLPSAVQSTVEHDLHHHRRMALNPFFSKKQINEFSPHIQQCAGRLCDRLLREYRGTSRVVTINDAWAAFATDIIMYYAFAWTDDCLDSPEFRAPFTNSIKELALSVHIAGHFPWFLAFLQSIPDRFVGIINPAMRPVFQFQNEIKSQIIKILTGANEGHKSVIHHTVFSDVLASGLPPQEKSVTRLQQEAAGIVGAAIETTKSTLVFATFHILHNPDIRTRLQQELQAAFPDPNKPPSLQEIERLPYLTGIIQESLRMTYGVAQRLPRISPTVTVPYNSAYTIPPNTPFSMSAYIQHNNTTLFPSPHTFNPARWLNNPTAPPLSPNTKTPASPKQQKPLTGYLVPFSKGTRMCLGQHLAWAELYIGLANVFRRVDLDLFDTGPEAVRMAREFFVPLPAEGTKGVRVTVVEKRKDGKL